MKKNSTFKALAVIAIVVSAINIYVTASVQRTTNNYVLDRLVKLDSINASYRSELKFKNRKLEVYDSLILNASKK